MKILFNSYMHINCSLLAAAIVFIRYTSQTFFVTTFSHSRSVFKNVETQFFAEEQTRRESFLAVNKLCKLATESYVSCVVQVTLFVWRFLDDKELCFFLYCRNFFRIFKTKILYYIFMTIFIFYGALKKSRVFLFHLIQLLINFDKEIRRQLHFILIQVHLFKYTRVVFCSKLTKVKTL